MFVGEESETLHVRPPCKLGVLLPDLFFEHFCDVLPSPGKPVPYDFRTYPDIGEPEHLIVPTPAPSQVYPRILRVPEPVPGQKYLNSLHDLGIMGCPVIRCPTLPDQRGPDYHPLLLVH